MLGSTLYRADLLRVLSAGEGTIPAEVAARLCGFEYEMSEPGEKPPLTLTHSTEPPPVVEPPVESPPTTEVPRFRFWRAEALAVEPEVSHRRRHETPPAIARAQPLTNADFCFSCSPSPGRPLLPWFRLWPFVRMALARPAFTRRPDVPQVVRHLAEGRSVRRLPCVQRSGWHPRARVLLDRREGLAPFWDDYDFLVRRLKAVRGTLGLRIESVPTLDLHDPTPDDCCQVGLDAPPESWRDLVRGSESTAVLILSDLNQFQSELLQAPWLGLGRQFRRRGVRPWVLCPCPRDRWTPALAHLWKLAAWDRGLRLPTAGRGQRAAPPASADLPVAILRRREQADQLAVRVSPAIRVERGLLRDVRLLLSHSEADAGTEYDLWQSVPGSTLGFTFPATQLRKLRIAFAALPLEDQATVIRLLQIHHAYCVNVFGHLEILALRDVLKPDRFEDLIREGVLTVDAIDRANEFIQRYVAALHRTPDALASGTDAFSARDLDRLQAHSRHGPELQALWMLSRREDGSPLPEWIKPDQLAWLDPLIQPDTRHEIRWRRGLNARDGHLLSAMQSRSAIFTATVEHPGGKVTHRHLWSEKKILESDRLAEAHRVTLQSDREKVELAQFTRPSWARRLWQDRFGLAAEFAVGGVPFVLRWIPPGRFLMGSPEDEPGRWTEDDREGPQHEVTISRGFWLGETPVTQAQWRAVVEATTLKRSRKRNELESSPSCFRGPPDLPVENVSWYDCRRFCELFNELLPEDPGFGLPTEAQWEYACRAGTTTPIYTGPLTIQGGNHSSELDLVAWYSGNSGMDLEVYNPVKGPDWPGKQRWQQQAGTHRVKLKRPNSWGLYDTLGNISEWCTDVWRDYSAKSKIESSPAGTGNTLGVFRGGSWINLARFCRAAFRDGAPPRFRSERLGIRLAAGHSLKAATPHRRSPEVPSTAE